MNDKATSNRSKPWPRWSKFVLTALFMTSVGAFVWSQLPKGSYPTDLSRIGAGRATVVLAQDANYAGGMAVMELLNTVRGDYAERVEFLVAHLGMADGQEFARQHAAHDGTVVLFAGDGSRLQTLHQPKSADELRVALNQAFGS